MANLLYGQDVLTHLDRKLPYKPGSDSLDQRYSKKHTIQLQKMKALTTNYNGDWNKNTT